MGEVEEEVCVRNTAPLVMTRDQFLDMGEQVQISDGGPLLLITNLREHETHWTVRATALSGGTLGDPRAMDENGEPAYVQQRIVSERERLTFMVVEATDDEDQVYRWYWELNPW